jgi:hypothetical protein
MTLPRPRINPSRSIHYGDSTRSLLQQVPRIDAQPPHVWRMSSITGGR